MEKLLIKYKCAIHEINMPEKEESDGVVKTMKFHISYLVATFPLKYMKHNSSVSYKLLNE